MKRKCQALVGKLLTKLLIMMASIIDFTGYFKRLLPCTSSVNVPPFFRLLQSIFFNFFLHYFNL